MREYKLELRPYINMSGRSFWREIELENERRTARGACRACERARAGSGMLLLAGGVPNAAPRVAGDTEQKDRQIWQPHVLEDEGGRKRRRRGARRLSAKGEEGETS
jgi:hypothetical protein